MEKHWKIIDICSYKVTYGWWPLLVVRHWDRLKFPHTSLHRSCIAIFQSLPDSLTAKLTNWTEVQKQGKLLLDGPAIFQSFTQSVSSQKSKQNMFKQFTLIFHSLCPDCWMCAKGIILISDSKNLVSEEMLAAVADKSRREILTISMLDGCFEGWIKCLMTVNWRLD